jgi:hypothetical protein
MKGGRKLSAWNLFVKKVYREGKNKNKNYSFKQALADASSRKSEMTKFKSTSMVESNTMTPNTNSKTKKGKTVKKGGKTRRRYK